MNPAETETDPWQTVTVLQPRHAEFIQHVHRLSRDYLMKVLTENTP